MKSHSSLKLGRKGRSKKEWLDQWIMSQDALMKHLTNHDASKHWCQTSGPLLPSSYLGIDVSNDHNTSLNPSIPDFLFSTMESDAYGEKAQKKWAHHRQDFIDGNAQSYARWLNSPECMEALSD
jgi:hypothetical protein